MAFGQNDRRSGGKGDELAGRALEVLERRFGYKQFRPGQAEVVSAILHGCDCVGVMPTGAGKSICYQVPALVLAHEGNQAAIEPGEGKTKSDAQSSFDEYEDDARWQGFDTAVISSFEPAQALTLVISPLVSLMSDQVMALKNAGIRAAFLNSRLSPSQQEEVLSRARAGAYALMYVAPERLSDERFMEFTQHMPFPISLIAVDEAHCVSQWGQDFRPSYLGIADFIAQLPTRPVVAAFTATATPRVADDIVRLLDLRNPLRMTTGFDRPNLHFAVEQLSDKKKLARIAARALANPNESGIIYCSTRKDVEQVHEALLAAGVRATRYHAGLAHGEREHNQRAFVNDDAPVMVATNAFGMGIDKSNVRYVIHHNMPGSLEAYYQEAGRAGRDGEPSECLLLWNEGDIATCRFFIEGESNNEALTYEEQEVVRSSQRRRLSAMAGYCMTAGCLRAHILRYFGETPAWEQERADVPPWLELPESPDSPESPEPSEHAQRGCGNCSNCDGTVDAVDVTKEARSIMRCVHELRGRYGKGVVADVLCGSKNQKIRDFGLMRARTYGIFEGSTSLVKEIIELLTAGDYLEITEGRYPLVGLGPRAREAATDEFRLYMKRMRKPQGKAKGAAGTASAAKTSAKTTLTTEAQHQMFERLRALRKRLADEEGVPPYIVFSDAALRSMCVTLPATDDEFLAVNGVGEVKLHRYGQAFMEEIARGEA